MNRAQRLLCMTPAQPPAFSIEPMELPRPRKGEVVIRVLASSVNPVDVKRSAGYGRRLLSLKGAGRFPLVLGNDIVGTVESVGDGVAAWRPGDRVVGLVPTGKGGAHATYVTVDSRWIRRSVDTYGQEAQAVLPYSFTTLWLSLRKAGINERNAKGLEVLVHGASGAMGQMAIQLLVRWGASVTAICSTANIPLCQSLGAKTIWNRLQQPIERLPQRYDAALNFGTWQDEAALISRLKIGAIGFATTVHPLLPNFDKFGWLAGAFQTWKDYRCFAAMAGAKGARYGWVVFKPEEEALDEMVWCLRNEALKLPIGIAMPLSSAQKAFEHVAQQLPGRAVLCPQP